MNKQGIGQSHAKIILMGEHSVVYGQPAIALPIPSVATQVTINSSNQPGKNIQSRYFDGPFEKLPAKMAGISKLINQLMAHFGGQKDDWNLIIKSDVPAERGMGSSAACSVAIVRAFFDYYQTPLDRQTLLKWADVEEQITHRSPSGLDAATVASKKPVWFRKGEKGEPFDLNLNATMVIADTGIKGATREAIMAVKDRLTKYPDQTQALLHDLGSLTEQSKQAIASDQSDKLGQILTKSHRDLQQLGVSDDQLDHLVNVAIKNDALGAKLTGGGRGGCMFAITKTAMGARKIAGILKENGATGTWIQPLN